MKRSEKKRGEKQEMTRAHAFDCVPVRNVHVRDVRQENGVFRVSYPMAVRPLVARVMGYFGKTACPSARTIELDELGTAVWKRIDGESTVRQIVRSFADEYQLHIKEAEASVTLFLRELGKRGIVGMK